MNEKQLTTISRRLQRTLSPERIDALGLETGWTKRRRVITPHRLALSLLCALATQKVETIADLQRAFNALTGQAVRYRPFYRQLTKATFPTFMRRLFSQLLTELALQVLAPLPSSALSRFTDILIQDGTSLTVHPSLREVWPGRFRNRAPAALKVHTTLSLFHDQPLRLSLSADASNERRYLPRAGSLAGKLLLADRGYDDVDYCARVDQAGGFVIIRFKGNINPVVRACWVDGRARKRLIGKPFQEVVGQLAGAHADLEVEWLPRRALPIWKAREQAVRLRLVIVWNPESQQHLLLATNLGRAEFSLWVVAGLYRLRWQVELLFKEWKSYANMRAFATGKRELATGMVWAALGAALIKRFLAHATQAVFRGIAVSTRRVAMASNYPLRELLQRALRGRGFASVLRELLAYLGREAPRSNPHRERERGRLTHGLEPVTGHLQYLWALP